MSTRPLVLIGGGEHAAVVAEAARLAEPGRALAGFIDVRPLGHGAHRAALPWLGDDLEGLRLARAGHHDFIVAVGAVGLYPTRRAIAERYAGAGARFVPVIHPRAIVSDNVRVGPGALILAGAVVGCGAVLGAHCLINSAAVVEHDVALGDHTILGPSAVVGGGTRVGADSFLGLGCRVRDHVQIGARVVLAMGAVLVGNANDDAVMMGVPARVREARHATRS